MAAPAAIIIITRTAGGVQLRSIEYLRKNPIPQSRIITPSRISQVVATAYSRATPAVRYSSPTVIQLAILCLVYFNGLAALFGTLGRVVKKPLYALWWIVLVACVCTACFTMMDNILTPLWYGFSKRAAKAYITASLPFMIPQIICTALSVGFLFLPLQKTFYLIGKNLFKMRKQQKKEG